MRDAIRWFKCKLKPPKNQVRFLYNIMIMQKGEGCLKKHSKKFCQMGISYQQYCEAFMNIYKITDNVKYRDFQYRLLMNVIFTNNRLVHWKLVDTANCNFCNTEIQTVVHLFSECTVTKKILHQLIEFLNKYTAIKSKELGIMTANIITNKIHEKPKHIANYLLLITKQYLFYCKCCGKMPTIEELMLRIENVYQVKHYNAVYTSRVINHQKKWYPYTHRTPQSGKKSKSKNLMEYIEEYINDKL